jgi:hypothetical protein
MTDAWQVVRAALRDTWSDLLTTAVVNLLWIVLTLLIVTAPPATLALFYVGNRIARGEPTDAGNFLRAFGRYFGVGWRWGILQVVVLFLLIGDLILTGRLSESAGARLAQGLYLAGLAVWLFLQLYVLAFLFEQEAQSVRMALRNGLLMLGRNLVFSTTLGILLLLLLVAGTIFFFVTFVAGGVFVALVGNHAVLNRLAVHRAAQTRQDR